MPILKSVLAALFLLIVGLSVSGQEPGYSVPEESWPESFGNHRAVIFIESDADAVHIAIPWRRHDPNPQDHLLLLVSQQSGDTIRNIHRIRVDREWCELLAGPVKKGIHHLYYLPFEVQEGHGFYNRDYLKQEPEAEKYWLDQFEHLNPPEATLMGLEARTSFDSFFPMEVIPFESEKKAFLKQHPEPYLLFTEDRLHPIRMWDEIPLRWIQEPKLNHFEGDAAINEYYFFQVGFYAVDSDMKDLEIEYPKLEGPEGASIAAGSFTCINMEGVDTYGRPFQKELEVRQGKVQALWIGIDIPGDAVPGTYKGILRLGPREMYKQELSIKLRIGPEYLADRGDGEAWRFSRLRWLNSQAGLDSLPTAPYTPIIQKDDSVFALSGKKVIINARGFPGSIKIGETEVLDRPIAFNILGPRGKEEFSPVRYHKAQNPGGLVSRTWSSESSRMTLSGESCLESDGYLNYRICLTAKKKCLLEDIRLEIPFSKEVAEYMMGMGLPGGSTPDYHRASWKGPEDSFWIGNTRGGLWVELRGSSYHGPLLNLYHPAPPESWSNHGKGGFQIKKGESELSARVFSGERKLKKGEKLVFEFALLLTPVKELDPQSQFRDRYYHHSASPDPGPEDLEAGIRIVNLHHANPFNPFINYPFKAADVMKPFVERNQEKGLKVKIYYTIRELTNHLPELWALRSLQGEIFDYGPGGGYPWLREHLVHGYRPQWYDHSDENIVDASLLTAPGDSRWINYYIEGLAWLVKNLDIDGLYMDDVSFDRHIMKRIRKVMDGVKPGCLIDLHSNTGFSKGPAIQYAEFFPYVNKLWFGESFLYNEMSHENWLVEVSGIPFGLMGDMLHGGGNPWLGMVYGMTTRLPWSTEGVRCNPVAIWNIWDEFKIEQSSLSGYWERKPLVETGKTEAKATAYIHPDKVLISVGNFSDDPLEVELNIDWGRLAFGPEGARLRAPEIEDFQEYHVWQPGEKIRIEARKGYLLYLEPALSQ